VEPELKSKFGNVGFGVPFFKPRPTSCSLLLYPSIPAVSASFATNPSLFVLSPKQSVNWNVGALLSRGFPLLDPPHKTRSGTLIGCGVMTGMVPGRLAPATDTAR
jgi:hypothetical protein